jgi:hypothetical protein
MKGAPKTVIDLCGYVSRRSEKRPFLRSENTADRNE